MFIEDDVNWIIAPMSTGGKKAQRALKSFRFFLLFKVSEIEFWLVFPFSMM